MNLRGWDYTGRNIGPEFHRQLFTIFRNLSDPVFVNGRSWGTLFQEELAAKVGLSSSGAIRTIKRLCDNFGFLNKAAFSGPIQCDQILSKRGASIFNIAEIEDQLENDLNISHEKRERAEAAIKALYEEIYCEALLNYTVMVRGKAFSPLRATLRALEKYSAMDKWEWYLLNTCVSCNDDPDEEALLDSYITKYRNGKISFTMNDVVKKPKGHQYTPQHFDFAGLVSLVQRPEWRITGSTQHQEIKQQALSDEFINKIKSGVF